MLPLLFPLIFMTPAIRPPLVVVESIVIGVVVRAAPAAIDDEEEEEEEVLLMDVDVVEVEVVVVVGCVEFAALVGWLLFVVVVAELQTSRMLLSICAGGCGGW